MAAGGAEGVHPGADRVAEAGILSGSLTRQSEKEKTAALTANYENWTIFSQSE
jgi:hypothetical protein